MWLSDLARSFRCAGRGLYSALRTERNLRIHTTVVCYVAAMGVIAALDAPRWGAVLLSCGAVIGAELMNTALECLCDALHPGQHPKIGLAKDTAAAGVLVLAGIAVCVGAAVFLPWLLDGGLLSACSAQPWLAPVLVISLVPAILWIK